MLSKLIAKTERAVVVILGNTVVKTTLTQNASMNACIVGQKIAIRGQTNRKKKLINKKKRRNVKLMHISTH